MAGREQVVAAIDHGTSSTRCLLYGRDGSIVSGHRLAHAPDTPRPGWVELDMARVWKLAQECVEAALAAGGRAPADVAAVGIANQRESAVLWERASGKPVGPSIVWQDTRTAAATEELAAEEGIDRFRDRTGLPISTYSTALKLRWLLDAEPSRRAAAERGELLFGTPDTWLVWNLTGGPDGGVHVTDSSNASRTLLMDLAALEWDTELLELMRIPRAVLPEIRSSAEIYGVATGALAGAPVAGILGDQQAALFGHGCVSAGQSKCTYGTGAFLLQTLGPSPVRSRQGLITTVAWQLGTERAVYALEGSIAVAGSVVRWLRDSLGMIDDAGEVEALAASVPDSGGVVFVPAFSGLFAPHWRSDARGVIAGLTQHTGREHVARAALEACAYQVAELVEAMRGDTGTKHLEELRVDGGMTENDLFLQLQADILGSDVVSPANAEMTALGAAHAAGLAVGFWAGEDDLPRGGELRVWHPRVDEDERQRGIARWRKGVARTLDWVDEFDYPPS